MSTGFPELFAAAERAAARGALQQAAELLEQARVAAEAAGTQAKELLPLFHALASTQQALGRADVADRYFEQLFAATRAAVPAGERELTAAAIALALNRAVTRGAESAASFLATFVEQQREQLGPEHAEVARAQARLGELSSRSGRHDVGRAQVEQALATGHDAALCRYLLALIDARRGAWAEAEAGLRAALADGDAELQATVGPELADVLLRKGDEAGAIAALTAALKAAPTASRAREVRGRLATLQVRRGKPADALPLLKENAFQLEDELGPASLPLGLALLELAATTTLAEPRSPPHDVFVRARQVLEVATGPSSLPVAHALLSHASVFLQPAADLEAGVALVHRALEIIGAAFGHEHPAVAEPLTYLAAFRWLARDPDRAAALSKRALELSGGAPSKDPALEAASALLSRDATRAAQALEMLRSLQR